MPTVEYRCPDGTPYPVTYDAPGDEEKRWGLDYEHCPLPMPPLEIALTRIGNAEGAAAYAELEFPPPTVFTTPPPRSPSGHGYFCMTPGTDDEWGRIIEAGGRLLERFGSAYALWREDSLPRVRAIVDELVAADAKVPLRHLAARHAHGQNHTMISAFVVYGDILQVQGICRDLYGDEVELVVNELAVGRDNHTVHAHRQLWEVGQLACGEPALVEAIAAPDPGAALDALRRNGGHEEFFGAFDAFLALHGARSEGWQLCQPTWAELGDGLWCQLRNVTAPGAVAPDDVLADAERRRTELVAEIESKLPSEAVESFRKGVEPLASYTAVREERAHWQLVLTGAFRQAVLRRGTALVEAGVLADADDVFFLLPDEVESPSADAASLAAARRAEHERWTGITPPPYVGKSEDGDAAVADKRASLRGKGVSRGTATGRARIARALCDADDFEAGDVLVCVTTTPPWTPLFSLAAAVVADSGNMGSHTAIAAREYGIPAVLDTKDATSRIPEGATVTVDGLAGTVEVIARQ